MNFPNSDRLYPDAFQMCSRIDLDSLALRCRCRMSRVQEVYGSMVIGSVVYNLVINGIYLGYNPVILTFDPNLTSCPGHPCPYGRWMEGR